MLWQHFWCLLKTHIPRSSVRSLSQKGLCPGIYTLRTFLCPLHVKKNSYIRLCGRPFFPTRVQILVLPLISLLSFCPPVWGWVWAANRWHTQIGYALNQETGYNGTDRVSRHQASMGRYLRLSNGGELSSPLGRAARSYLNLENLNVIWPFP